MNADERLTRYREFQSYVGWTPEDARRVALVATAAEPWLPGLIDDFYDAIERNDATRRLITGGQAQVARLKLSLTHWVRTLLAGELDEATVRQRWQAGWRHADIGLDASYVNLALSRLRDGLARVVESAESIPNEEKAAVLRSLHIRLDLDLALIEDAYQTEHRARLRSSERMATIGQVTGGVAHELRNPLNVVRTSVYYLLNAKNPTPEKAREHLNRIERQVDLADSVIKALSNFARTPIPTARAFRVDELVREVVEQEAPGAGIAVEVDVPEGLPDGLADRDQLRIVIANVVRNALDAMPKGGSLRIEVQAAPDVDRIDVAVRDTGGGIAEEDLSRIMEPLFSTKARGLGLGLSIARSILEKNQGFMSVASSPGVGSLFTIRFPSRSETRGDDA